MDNNIPKLVPELEIKQNPNGFQYVGDCVAPEVLYVQNKDNSRTFYCPVLKKDVTLDHGKCTERTCEYYV